MSQPPRTVSVIDSHTAAEPTRVVLDGIPDLGPGSLKDQAAVFSRQFDSLRRGIICEPRGCDWLVGALLLPATTPDVAAGVIFFNNVGTLGMCGHGMIGVVETLRHLGQVEPGTHKFETPVGVVTATLHDDFRVSVRNVESYRYQSEIAVEVPGYGLVHGDIAYGGNWFFLTKVEEIQPAIRSELDAFAKAIRKALDDQHITGADESPIDHVELYCSVDDGSCDARNYVLCPGGEYDRSPCGTGTSAKLACLAADGHFSPAETWRQQSLCGGVFEATYQPGTTADRIVPTITGRAFITGVTTLQFDPADDFANGMC